MTGTKHRCFAGRIASVVHVESANLDDLTIGRYRIDDSPAMLEIPSKARRLSRFEWSFVAGGYDTWYRLSSNP